MPSFRSTRKVIIPSRLKRFARFLEQFLTPTPSREKALFGLNFFLNPGIKRDGVMGVVNELFNPRVRRFGVWKILSQFFRPEPSRSHILGKVVTAFFDAPVYRLQQSRDIIRPRQADPTFLQKLISGLNEFLNSYAHFSDLFPDVTIEQPTDAFRNALERLVFGSRLRIERMTEDLMEGKISPREYQAMMIAEIRKTNIAAAMLGIKGIGNLTISAMDAIDARVASEIARLNKFLADSFGPNFQQPLDHSRLSERQFRAYALRFASAGRATSTVAQIELMQSLYAAGMAIGGTLYHRRVVQGDDRSCDDCVEWAAIGWVRIDGGNTLPPPGTGCICESNCRCLYEFCLAFLAGDCPEEYG